MAGEEDDAKQRLQRFIHSLDWAALTTLEQLIKTRKKTLKLSPRTGSEFAGRVGHRTPRRRERNATRLQSSRGTNNSHRRSDKKVSAWGA